MRKDEYLRYRNFAMIIVTYAIKDYRRYLRKYKRNPHDEMTIIELDLLETFFRSGGYRTLTNDSFDGERLIKEIQTQEGVFEV